MPNSVNASPKAWNKDDVFMKNRSQFADSLKDLKNLRKQLYSAADCFESSYLNNEDNHKKFVVESSRDYVAKALVRTVDHLGSVADKLNKLLDEKANKFSETNIQFSVIEQRLNACRGFIYIRGHSQHLFKMEEAKISHYKHSILPEETFASDKPKALPRNSVSSVPYDVQQPKQENPFCKAFQATRMKIDQPLPRKEVKSRLPSREPSPNRHNFSFKKIITNKEAGRQALSPLYLPFNLSGSFTRRSVSPTPFVNKPRCASEPRRPMSACRRRQETMTSSREREKEESYAKRSKHLFKALLSLHHSRKETLHKQA